MERAQPGTAPEEFHHALAALSASLEDGIQALVAWDMSAFGTAVERQGALCAGLSAVPFPASAAQKTELRRTRELARQYGHLLRHSSQWTRTMRSILRAGGHDPDSTRATVHLRG
jgi:hypothetical protein